MSRNKGRSGTVLGRRAALRRMGGAGLAAAWALRLRDAGAAAAEGSLLQRPIPSSGERLPAVGLGTWQTFDVGPGEAARAPLREVLRRLVELGGRVVDSSPMYGRAETVVGELAGELGIRDELFIATKVWTRGRVDGVRQMERSMARFGVDSIELMQVHNLVDWRTHLATLRDWKANGRIRHLGVTHYTSAAYDELARIMRSEDIDFVQLNYSIAARRAEQRLLPLAAERGIAVLANRPFAGGSLFRRVKGKRLPQWAAEFDCETWAQFFLKYILAHPALTCAIPGTSDPEHLVDNVRAGYGRLPDAATRRRMAALMDGLA